MYFLKKIGRFNHPNLVRFIEEFHYQENHCLVLEILHKDILHAVKNHEWKMQLNKIRLIAKQVRIIVICYIDMLNSKKKSMPSSSSAVTNGHKHPHEGRHRAL